MSLPATGANGGIRTTHPSRMNKKRPKWVTIDPKAPDTTQTAPAGPQSHGYDRVSPSTPHSAPPAPDLKNRKVSISPTSQLKPAKSPSRDKAGQRFPNPNPKTMTGHSNQTNKPMVDGLSVEITQNTEKSATQVATAHASFYGADRTDIRRHESFVKWGGRRYKYILERPKDTKDVNDEQKFKEAIAKGIEVFLKDLKANTQIKPGENFNVIFTDTGYIAYVPDADNSFDAENNSIEEGERLGFITRKEEVKKPSAQALSEIMQNPDPDEMIQELDTNVHLQTYRPSTPKAPAIASAPKPPVKLKNLGNYCPVNAAFQALAFDPHIRKSMLNNSKLFKNAHQNPLYAALARYDKAQENGTTSELDLTQLKKALFESTQQQDANEAWLFLGHMLNTDQSSPLYFESQKELCYIDDATNKPVWIKSESNPDKGMLAQKPFSLNNSRDFAKYYSSGLEATEPWDKQIPTTDGKTKTVKIIASRDEYLTPPNFECISVHRVIADPNTLPEQAKIDLIDYLLRCEISAQDKKELLPVNVANIDRGQKIALADAIVKDEKKFKLAMKQKPAQRPAPTTSDAKKQIIKDIKNILKSPAQSQLNELFGSNTDLKNRFAATSMTDADRILLADAIIENPKSYTFASGLIDREETNNIWRQIQQVKDTREIDFPMEHDGRQLRSFIYHQGTQVGNGHYITYGKQGNKYWKMSDSQVTELTSEAEIQEFNQRLKQASMVFYAKEEAFKAALPADSSTPAASSTSNMTESGNEIVESELIDPNTGIKSSVESGKLLDAGSGFVVVNPTNDILLQRANSANKEIFGRIHGMEDLVNGAKKDWWNANKKTLFDRKPPEDIIVPVGKVIKTGDDKTQKVLHVVVAKNTSEGGIKEAVTNSLLEAQKLGIQQVAFPLIANEDYTPQQILNWMKEAISKYISGNRANTKHVREIKIILTPEQRQELDKSPPSGTPNSSTPTSTTSGTPNPSTPTSTKSASPAASLPSSPSVTEQTNTPAPTDPSSDGKGASDTAEVDDAVDPLDEAAEELSKKKQQDLNAYLGKKIHINDQNREIHLTNIPVTNEAEMNVFLDLLDQHMKKPNRISVELPTTLTLSAATNAKLESILNKFAPKPLVTAPPSVASSATTTPTLLSPIGAPPSPAPTEVPKTDDVASSPPAPDKAPTQLTPISSTLTPPITTPASSGISSTLKWLYGRGPFYWLNKTN